MKRAYANIDGPDAKWQIHYRSAGHGTALVMLHPSPLSGAALVPQIELLAPLARCIAWDAPGYGASDPLPPAFDEDTGLEPYVSSLKAFLEALGIEQALLYGSATGAQIAIEFAKAHHQHCAGLLLENVAAFSEQEIETITDGYFPDFAPRADGGHLTGIWDMAQRTTRYFPWQSQDPQAQRRDAYPAPAIINGIARDTLCAGPDYARAYRAAFANERLDTLQAVTVATRIVLWEDGVLGSYGERIGAVSQPDNIRVIRAASGMQARLSAVRRAAVELLPMHQGDEP
ncbi:MAG: pimeloyl-ACP methyl ester carboxylesterase [Halieaceae bacterium]|jgi:pimeloyl-ACP methyl ester carboxylesterase